MSTGTAGCCSYWLRSLLRYLAVCGLADPGLANAVPRVARWRAGAIPQFPARLHIDRLLATCDREEPTGARDYAALLLLARLGLRAVEVSRLRLDDLDWRAGEITVDGKAHRLDQLPLRSDVGEAIVAHLQHLSRITDASCVAANRYANDPQATVRRLSDGPHDHRIAVAIRTRP